MKIKFKAAETSQAQESLRKLEEKHGNALARDADVIVVLGGDGFMLEMLHRYVGYDLPIYGVNRGSVGFLMNAFHPDGLVERIEASRNIVLHPLRMQAADTGGAVTEALAFNEVSLLRASRQAAHLAVSVDGRERMAQLVCDGALLATPAGSTAYNFSAHGPILPLKSPLLALTPISAFRPRHWRGALLNDTVSVDFTVLEPRKRPVSAVADHIEAPNVARVSVRSDASVGVTLLFDPDESLEERVFREQFLES